MALKSITIDRTTWWDFKVCSHCFLILERQSSCSGFKHSWFLNCFLACTPSQILYEVQKKKNKKNQEENPTSCRWCVEILLILKQWPPALANTLPSFGELL